MVPRIELAQLLQHSFTFNPDAPDFNPCDVGVLSVLTASVDGLPTSPQGSYEGTEMEVLSIDRSSELTVEECVQVPKIIPQEGSIQQTVELCDEVSKLVEAGKAAMGNGRIASELLDEDVEEQVDHYVDAHVQRHLGEHVHIPVAQQYLHHIPMHVDHVVDIPIPHEREVEILHVPRINPQERTIQQTVRCEHLHPDAENEHGSFDETNSDFLLVSTMADAKVESDTDSETDSFHSVPEGSWWTVQDLEELCRRTAEQTATITTERLTQGIESFSAEIRELTVQHQCQMAEKCCEIASLEICLSQRDNDNEDLVEIISKMKRNKATTEAEKQTIKDCLTTFARAHGHRDGRWPKETK